jgi:hypothetical protein
MAITIGFLHIGAFSEIVPIMIRSVRAAMPAASIVQMTDQATAPMAGVDQVIRKHYDGVHLMTYRLRHLSEFPSCEALFLDTDVVVQQDLSQLFEQTFDIALTRRDKAIPTPNGVDVAKVAPYNTGVMLSKPSGSEFWLHAHDYCARMSDEYQKWWGDQLAVKAIAEVAPLRIMELPCEIFNYTPASEREDLSGKAVVHYKGDRKAWMLRAGMIAAGRSRTGA